MTKPKNFGITYSYLHEILFYDPQMGIWTWAIKIPHTKFNIGDVAGCQNTHGYWQIKINKRIYMAHRLAWLYMTGEWPEFEIDHGDTNKLNNKWSNLRSATRSQNEANVGIMKTNTSGLKGICLKRDKWQAQIRYRGRKIYLGVRDTAEEAYALYCKAAKEYFGEYTREVI